MRVIPETKQVAEAMFKDYYIHTMGAMPETADRRWQEMTSQAMNPWFRRANVAITILRPELFK